MLSDGRSRQTTFRTLTSWSLFFFDFAAETTTPKGHHSTNLTHRARKKNIIDIYEQCAHQSAPRSGTSRKPNSTKKSPEKTLRYVLLISMIVFYVFSSLSLSLTIAMRALLSAGVGKKLSRALSARKDDLDVPR